MSEFYLATTPSVIVSIILCLVIENKFPELVKDNGKKIKVSIDTSNPIQGILLTLIILLLLFTPVINVIILCIYASNIIAHFIKFQMQKK